MTQSEFIKSYCKRSDIAEQVLNDNDQIAMPCHCNQGSCGGWAMVNIISLQAHLDLYVQEGK